MANRKTVKLETVVDVFSELSIRQAGKLIKAIAAYNAKQEYESFLDEYLKPIFLVIVKQ